MAWLQMDSKSRRSPLAGPIVPLASPAGAAPLDAAVTADRSEVLLHTTHRFSPVHCMPCTEVVPSAACHSQLQTHLAAPESLKADI